MSENFMKGKCVPCGETQAAYDAQEDAPAQVRHLMRGGVNKQSLRQARPTLPDSYLVLINTDARH